MNIVSLVEDVIIFAFLIFLNENYQEFKINEGILNGIDLGEGILVNGGENGIDRFWDYDSGEIFKNFYFLFNLEV